MLPLWSERGLHTMHTLPDESRGRRPEQVTVTRRRLLDELGRVGVFNIA